MIAFTEYALRKHARIASYRIASHSIASVNAIASHSEVALWIINTLTARSNEQQLSLAREQE